MYLNTRIFQINLGEVLILMRS